MVLVVLDIFRNNLTSGLQPDRTHLIPISIDSLTVTICNAASQVAQYSHASLMLPLESRHK